MIKNFLSVFKMDLQRAFFSSGFLIGMLSAVAIWFFGSVGMKLSNLSAVAAFNDIYKYNNITQLLFLAATFTYSTAFCIDWQTRFIYPLMIRSDATAYLLSKCITAAVAGGLAITAGSCLFIFFLCINQPGILPSAQELEMEFSAQAFGDLLADGQTAQYFIAYLIIIFLQAAFFSSLGLMTSGFLPNPYAACAAPFLLCFMLNQFANVLDLPIWLNPVRLATVRVLHISSPVILIRATASFLTFTVICNAIFIRQAKRKIANG